MLIKVKCERRDGTVSTSSLLSINSDVPLVTQTDRVASRIGLDAGDLAASFVLVAAGAGEGGADRVFSDSDTLASFGLKNGSIITVRPRAEGGATGAGAPVAAASSEARGAAALSEARGADSRR